MGETFESGKESQRWDESVTMVLIPKGSSKHNMKLFQMFALGTVVTTGLAMAQIPAAPAPSAAPAAAKAAAKEVKDKAIPAPPTAAQIADAKAKGMVWCNTNSKACHDSDDKFFGATKRGEFMMKADLAAKGYHMAGETKGAAAAKAGKKAVADAKKQ